MNHRYADPRQAVFTPPGAHVLSSRACPELSVVVPLYNKAPYIRRCLESIQSQTFENFEVIVVDDGSTDGSASAAQEVIGDDARFRILSQANRGSGAARNRGIAEAKAPLIAFLDADDAWDPKFSEAIVGLAARYLSAGVFATGYRRRLDSGIDKLVSLRTRQRSGLIRDYLRIARQGDLVTSSSVAVRQALLAQVGGFLEGQPLGEDQELWFRLALFSPVAFDRRILATYHSESSGRTCKVLGPLVDLYPATVSLWRMLDDGSMPADRRREGALHADWLLLQQALTMLWDCSREQVQSVLRADRFRTFSYRLRAALLRWSVALIPLRLLAAVRLKPAAWLRAARQWAPAGAFAGMVESVLRIRVRVQFVRTPVPPEWATSAEYSLGREGAGESGGSSN